MNYYILVLSGGTEIAREGPFVTPHDRDAAARQMWAHTVDREQENIFRADVGEQGQLYVSVFVSDELE